MPKQVRDKNGNFVPKTKTNIVRHQIRTKKYLIPIMLVVIAVGGYVVSRSFASTTTIYSYTKCAPRYDDICLQDSAEANVATLYQAVLGREADPSGLNYYSKKVVSGGQNYGQVASNLLASSKGKERFPSADPVVFVQALYTNLLNRKPTGAEQNQWVGYLAAKKLNLGQVAARLVLETEYKSQQAGDSVALVKNRYQLKPTALPYQTVAQFELAGKNTNLCSGKVEFSTANNANVCVVSTTDTMQGEFKRVASLPIGTLSPGAYDVVVTVEKNTSGGTPILTTFTRSDNLTGITTSLAGSKTDGSERIYQTEAGQFGGRLYFDRRSPAANARLTLFTRDAARLGIVKVELRRSTDDVVRRFFLQSEATYSGFVDDKYDTSRYSNDINNLASEAPYGNPSLRLFPDEIDKECQFDKQGKVCTVSVIHTAPAGTHNLLGQLWNKVGATGQPINFEVKVTNVANNQVVSSSKVQATRDIFTKRWREYSMPVNLRTISALDLISGYTEYAASYTVAGKATVKIELIFTQTGPTAKNGSSSISEYASLWTLTSSPAR